MDEFQTMEAAIAAYVRIYVTDETMTEIWGEFQPRLDTEGVVQSITEEVIDTALRLTQPYDYAQERIEERA